MANLKTIIGEELFKQLSAEKQKELEKKDFEDISDGAYIPKDRFNQVNTEAKDYKKQVAERDTQISKLKDEFKDTAGLKVKVEQLEKDNKAKDDDYQTKLKQVQFDNALEQSLKGTNTKNVKALKALLDIEKVKLDGETLIGLNEQIEAIKKSNDYLFEKTVKGTGAFNTGGAGKENEPGKVNFAENLGKAKAEQLKTKGISDFIK